MSRLLEGQAHWRRLGVIDPPTTGAGQLWGATARFTIALSLLLAGALGAALVAGGSSVGAGLIALVWQIGPGLGAVLLARVRPAHRVVLYGVTLGVTSLAIATTAVARFSPLNPGRWAAVWLAVSWSVLTVVLLVAVLVKDRHGWRGWLNLTMGERPTRATWTTWLLAGAGWLAAMGAAAANQRAPQPSGMALSAGPVWWLAALAVAAAVVLSLVAAPRARALAVLAAVTLVPFGQALMYRLPTMLVAGRHVGIGEFAAAHGLTRTHDDIYQAWAGLFSSTAFTTSLTGIADPLALATCWGALSAPMMVLAVRGVAGRFLPAPQAWLAALVFGWGNALNTPFYAPQMLGFVAAFAVITALLGPIEADRPRTRLGRIGLTMVISSGMALTHQLSPYLAVSAAIVLVVFRVLRAWWAPLIIAVPAVVWLGLNLGVMSRYVTPDRFGKVWQNLLPPTHPVAPFGLPWENRVTFQLPAVALVVIGVVALVVWWRRRTRLEWALAAAALSSVAVMAATNYGSEGIFRVSLFALPWLAILAASAGEPANLRPPRPMRAQSDERFPRRPLPWLGASLAVVSLLVVHVIGSTGMDWARAMRPGDVTITRYYERTAPEGSLLLFPGSQLGTPVTLTDRYFEIGYLGRDTLVEQTEPGRTSFYSSEVGSAYDAEGDLTMVTQLFERLPATEHYLMMSDSGMAYNARYGLWPVSSFRSFRAAVERSDRWELVMRSDDAVLYRLRQS